MARQAAGAQESPAEGNGRAPGAPPKGKAARRRRVKVSGADVAMLDGVIAFIGRFLVMTDAQRLIVALWAIHTHLVEHIEQTPYLAVTSPQSGCAKTRVLEVLEVLVARPMRTARPSEAVMFRSLQANMPTVLWDEVDTMLSPQQARFHEGLRAVLDEGHRRNGAAVPRASDFGRKIEYFRCYSAKALAGIGTLPDTVASRSIYLRMERKRRSDKVERFIYRDVSVEAAPLREQVAAWADKHTKRIARARPAMPDELSDRMQEGCESLVAIADALGCGDGARTALVELLGGDRLDTHQSMAERLLRDLHGIWMEAERGREGIVPAAHTHRLLLKLHAIDESPWPNYYGRSFDANDLANLLGQYGVRSTTVKVARKSLKGYRRDALWPVFERYLVTEVTEVTASS